jgi:hypothetical protein
MSRPWPWLLAQMTALLLLCFGFCCAPGWHVQGPASGLCQTCTAGNSAWWQNDGENRMVVPKMDGLQCPFRNEHRSQTKV